MKHGTLIMTITTVLFLGLVTASFAATQRDATRYFDGIVLAVNEHTNRLAVVEAGLGPGETAKSTFTFVVEPDSRITKNRQTIELAGIRRGDPVSVEYTIAGNTKLARTIEVLTAPPPSDRDGANLRSSGDSTERSSLP